MVVRMTYRIIGGSILSRRSWLGGITGSGRRSLPVLAVFLHGGADFLAVEFAVAVSVETLKHLLGECVGPGLLFRAELAVLVGIEAPQLVLVADFFTGVLAFLLVEAAVAVGVKAGDHLLAGFLPGAGRLAALGAAGFAGGLFFLGRELAVTIGVEALLAGRVLLAALAALAGAGFLLLRVEGEGGGEAAGQAQEGDCVEYSHGY